MAARSLCVLAALCLMGVLQSAQKPAVTRHDLAVQTLMDLNSNIRLKKVMGEIGTLALGEFNAGFRSTPHHHTYEQINVGLSGAFTLVVAGIRHRVARWQGVLIPPDVLHNNDVPPETENPVLIEFQSARRVDFPPEREKFVLPVGPTALPVPAGHHVALDFRGTSTGWDTMSNGVRMKAATGTTVAVAAWEVPSMAGEWLQLRRQLPAGEQFTYLAEGSIESGAGTEQFAMTPGVVLVSPPGGPPLRVRANGAQPAVLLVFEAGR